MNKKSVFNESTPNIQEVKRLVKTNLEVKLILPIVGLLLQILKHELCYLARAMIHLSTVNNAEIIIWKIKCDSVLQSKQHPG